MSSNTEIKVGSVLSYLQMLINIIIGFTYTPIMIKLLGQSEYGVYSAAASVIASLGILSLGFNSGYIRYYSGYRKQNDEVSINRLNGLFLLIFFSIGAIALFCGIIISQNLDVFFSNGFSSQEYALAKKLTILLSINLAWSFPASVFQNIISANEKFIFLKTVNMIKTVVGPLVSLPLLFSGLGSPSIITVTIVVSLIADSINIFYVVNKLHHRFIFTGITWKLFRSLFSYTGFIAINMIVNLINWNIDKMLLGRFKGAVAVSIYSVGYSLYSYYELFSTSVSGVFTPRIHAIFNMYKNDSFSLKKNFSELFIKVGRIQFIILGLIASGFCLFGQSFIFFWVGKGYEDSFFVAILLMLPASIPLIQNIGIEIQRAENKHRFRSVAYLIMAIVNLIGSVFLCQRYGAVGAALGTAVSLVLANGIIMNIYYHKHCHIDIILFWRSIVRLSFGLIMPIITGVIMKRTIRIESLLSLALCIIIYAIVYCFSVWLFGMNEYEKGLCKSLFHKN